MIDLVVRDASDSTSLSFFFSLSLEIAQEKAASALERDFCSFLQLHSYTRGTGSKRGKNSFLPDPAIGGGLGCVLFFPSSTISPEART